MTKGHLNRVYTALQTIRDGEHPYTETERRHLDNALTVMRVYRKPVERCTRDEMQHRNPICPWCGRALLSTVNAETGKHSWECVCRGGEDSYRKGE